MEPGLARRAALTGLAGLAIGLIEAVAALDEAPLRGIGEAVVVSGVAVTVFALPATALAVGAGLLWIVGGLGLAWRGCPPPCSRFSPGWPCELVSSFPSQAAHRSR